MTTTKSKIVQPELPPLPMPDGTLYGQDRTVRGHSYLPAKVRAYAQAYGDARAAAAVLAEREARIAELEAEVERRVDGADALRNGWLVDNGHVVPL